MCARIMPPLFCVRHLCVKCHALTRPPLAPSLSSWPAAKCQIQDTGDGTFLVRPHTNAGVSQRPTYAFESRCACCGAEHACTHDPGQTRTSRTMKQLHACMDPLECFRKPDQAAVDSIPRASAHLLDFIRCALFVFRRSLQVWSDSSTILALCCLHI
jgi:hypothetical protein